MDLPERHQAIDACLRAARDLVWRLYEEFDDYFGDVGENSAMSSLISSMAVCWDFAELLVSPPNGHHVNAFLNVVGVLRPFLKHTLWPDVVEYPDVKRTWELSDRDLAEQYITLCKRLRIMAGKHLHLERWYPVVAYQVVAVALPGAVLAAVKRWKYRKFIHMFLAVDIGPQFRVDAAVLRAPGYAKARSHARQLEGRFRGDAGAVAVLASKHFIGRMVRVCSFVRKLNWSAVSADIDGDRLVCQGCWHAVRVHHRCRVFGATESCCERVGSHMHALWNSTQGFQPLVDRVLLRSAGVRCVGSDLDEALVCEIANMLETKLAFHPHVKRRTVLKRKREGVGASRQVDTLRSNVGEKRAAMGRSQQLPEDNAGDDEADGDVHISLDISRGSRVAWQEERSMLRERRAPKQLDSCDAEYLHKIVCHPRDSLGRPGLARALPIFAEDKRTEHKSRAMSVVSCIPQILNKITTKQHRLGHLVGCGAPRTAKLQHILRNLQKFQQTMKIFKPYLSVLRKIQGNLQKI